MKDMEDKQRLEDKIKRWMDVVPVDFEELDGGMIGTVHEVSLEGGKKIVAKTGSDHLDIEGYMLRYLDEKSALPVPEVYHSSEELLLMEHISGGSKIDEDVERHAADLLSRLHENTWHSYGFHIQTNSGPIMQPNGPDSSWVDFFRENRLKYMVDLVERAGTVPEGTLNRIRVLSKDLDDHLIEPKRPSLIHGDVWKTNILVSDGSINAFLDPATYYAHHEMELAYIVFCGTFGDTFFDRYDEHRGIESGFFDERCPIYNLYPLMIHAHLFGEDYPERIMDNLDKIGY